MPPKKKSKVEWVDGVHCSFNLATGNVTVGSGLVGHDQRDCFKLKAGSSLATQVRARTKFKQLTAAAAAAAAASQDDAPLHIFPAGEGQISTTSFPHIYIK